MNLDAMFNVTNIRELPWVQDKDIERLGAGRSVLFLPEVSKVFEEARKVFERSHQIQATWENTAEFLRREEVGDYLRTLMIAAQEIKESSSHTQIFCEWKDGQYVVKQ